MVHKDVTSNNTCQFKKKKKIKMCFFNFKHLQPQEEIIIITIISCTMSSIMYWTLKKIIKE